MRAVRYHGNRDIRVDEIPEPVCKANEVKIAPAYVGLCGSDIHEYISGPITIPTTPHPLTGESLPIVLGHEFSGVIVELGSAAAASSTLKPGNRCVVQPTISCGTCRPCRSGAENCCYQGGFIGITGGGGGLAELCCVPVERVVILPENVSLKHAALVEPFAVAHHAVVASGVVPGDSVLVMGAGPIGLAVVQVLRTKGVEDVILSEVAAERKTFALKLGARKVIDPAVEDVVGEVLKICEDDGGVAVVFDCAGVESSFDAAFKVVRARGVVVNLALWERPVAFNPNVTLHREVRYMGSVGTIRSDFEVILEAAGGGRLKLDDMITKVSTFDDVIEGGFEELVARKASHIKILFEVSPQT